MTPATDPRDTDLTAVLHDAVADVEPADRLDEIRAAADTRRGGARRARWYAVGGGALAVAAALTGFAVLASPEGPSAPDPDDPGPATTPEPGAEAVAVAAYYVGDSPLGDRLYREFHRLPGSDPATALAELSEAPDDPDYRTFWAPGQLRGAQVVRDVIEVEVDPATVGIADAPCAPDCGLAVEQVVYTVQAAVGRGRLPVQFVSPDGNPLAEVLGVPTSEPLANGAPLDVLALVSISDPVEGQVVSGSFTARGAASVFEGTVVWQLRDPQGLAVREGFTTAGMDERLVPWETEPIDVSDLPPGTYTFAASETDPSDGEGRGVFTDTRTVVVE